MGPPPTPAPTSGWGRLGEKDGFFVRGLGDGYSFVPQQPRLAHDAQGRPRVALTLILSRMPSPNEPSIAPLVVSGSLALVLTLAVENDEIGALEARLNAPCAPLFVRGGASTLRDDSTAYATSPILGANAQWWLGTSLPPQRALDLLYAFDGIASSLRISVDLPNGPKINDTPIAALLGGIVDGLDRGRYVSLIVVNADGTSTPVPELKRKSGNGASRESPSPPLFLADGRRYVALPFAMTPSHAVQPSAAALIAGGATGESIAVNGHAHLWLGNDAIASDAPAMDQHYPLVVNPSAPYWQDALDATIAWYAPAFRLVAPNPSDAPAKAAFSFTLARTGAAVGPGGGLQPGLTASLQLTIDQIMPDETAAALQGGGAATANLKAQPVPLQNLSGALEIPYRQAGSSSILTQRFPGTLAQDGTRLTLTVNLLDDWVRLAYSALAYPPAQGDPQARLIIDYAFMSYARVPRFDNQGAVGGGLVNRLSAVEAASELPHQISAPILVRRDLAVVGPASTVSYRLEEAGAPRALPNQAAAATLLATVRPELTTIFRPPWRIITRSLVREETVNAALPCASFGSFYLQRADDGSLTAIGCQDSLKLGETALRAFDEIAALRDPSFRVHRSLQQPGRFLVAPSAYRVGRYGTGAAEKAFRPMIVLYGLLGDDPAKNRYALTATLIPDVPAFALAKLNERLGPYTPAGTPPVVVYPTDPFVAAKVTYSWAVPGGLDPPTAMTVLDTVSVTITMPVADAALVTAMINRGGVQGAITFTLPDGTALNAALSLDTNVVGPAESGPVTVSVQGQTATLLNRTQQTMSVADLVTVTASGATQTLPMNTTLPAGASATASVGAGVMAAFADASATAPETIDELDVFVEDITLGVTFINQVNFANHQLTALGVQARLKNTEHIESIDLPEGKTADLSFTLPITSYLQQQTLQYALVETRSGPPPSLTWRDWDLGKGTVIGITADQL